MKRPTLIALMMGIVCCAAQGPAAERPVADLIASLQAADTASQIEALVALEAKGADAAAAVPALIGLLKAASADVRAHAAETLGAIGASARPAAEELAGLAGGDADPMVRREAIEALASIRPGPKVMLPVLARLLKDPDPAVRARVLGAVADQGIAAKELLLSALENKETAYWASLVVSELGPQIPEAVPALVKLLDSEDPAMRREAALALAAIGEAATAALPGLESMIDDPLHSAAAIYALGRIGKVTSGAVSKLIAKAEGGRPVEKTVSAWALARLHPGDKRYVRKAVTLLIASLQSDDPRVRLAAAKGLEPLDGEPQIIRPIILEALNKADEKTLIAMLDAIATLGPQIVPRLVGTLEIEAARPYVCYILGHLGPEAAAAVDGLVKVLADKDPAARHEAMMALAEIGPAAKAAVPALAEALESPDRDRFAAAYALGRIGRDAIDAKPALLALLENEDHALALISAWALAYIHPECPTCCAKALPVLIAGLGDSEASFRKEAVSGLRCFGKTDKRAGEALKKALDDPDEDVRKAAAEALEAIGQ
ncbi:MAG: HEAT repeat domain-containing protein [Pirellulales bacterium]|nr:HEAT repeat domain-containing protein [Pirellulales bacterium]